MDCTCTPHLYNCECADFPALCVEVSEDVEFERLHRLCDILFPITYSETIRISVISSLIIMPQRLQQYAHTRTHTHAHERLCTHTQTNTSSIKDRLIKGNNLISVIKQGIIERLVHGDKLKKAVIVFARAHTHARAHIPPLWELTQLVGHRCSSRRIAHQFVWQ